MNKLVVGLYWDDYTPLVESRVLMDLLTLDSNKGNTEIQIVTISDEANKLIAKFGFTKFSIKSMAQLWKFYKTKEEWPELDDVYDNIVLCDLYQQPANIDISRDGAPPFVPKEPRSGWGNSTLNRPPPRHSTYIFDTRTPPI